MKLLFDLFPVILFFVAYKLVDIYVATGVAIVATFTQITWLKLRGKPVDRMLWISLAIIVVMRGATLLLHDPTFSKWKPTVLYWAFALVLLGASLFFRKNLIRTMMQQQVELPDPVGARLNLSWVALFAFMGVANRWRTGWRTSKGWCSIPCWEPPTRRWSASGPWPDISAGSWRRGWRVRRQAATLCKADIVTEMVGQFPSLQGVMGSKYAQLAGVADAVAAAIFTHYLPRHADDELPPDAVGALVGLADRLDTICGCFGVGLIPTGAADPYGLRLHALAIIRIVFSGSDPGPSAN